MKYSHVHSIMREILLSQGQRITHVEFGRISMLLSRQQLREGTSDKLRCDDLVVFLLLLPNISIILILSSTTTYL
jgi:hypothetical protein